MKRKAARSPFSASKISEISFDAARSFSCTGFTPKTISLRDGMEKRQFTLGDFTNRVALVNMPQGEAQNSIPLLDFRSHSAVFFGLARIHFRAVDWAHLETDRIGRDARSPNATDR